MNKQSKSDNSSKKNERKENKKSVEKTKSEILAETYGLSKDARVIMG